MLKLPDSLMRAILHFQIGRLMKYVPYEAKAKLLAPRYPREVLMGQRGHDCLRTRIQQGSALMVSRFGNTELACILYYLNQRLKENKLYPELIRNDILNCSGFFPITEESIDAFCEMFLDHAKNTDILGVWFNPDEDVICRDYCKDAELVELGCLEPFWFHQPWSRELEGKKVLVVHPFVESIRSQYSEKRHLLFKDKSILPDFDLKTIQAVQGLGNAPVPFPTWFDSYKYMCDEIAKVDFDICLIGAGAYGLPLASFVKQMNLQAIHLGGVTQILFGIRGRRWESEYADTTGRLFNEHWVRPLPSETPPSKKVVDAYW